MYFIAGITVAIFFELLLLFKKNKSNADKILIVWMFFITLHIFLYYLDYTNVNIQFPFLLGIDLPFPLIQGVMLYLYVASATNQLPKNKTILLLHFIPTLAAYIYLITFFTLPVDEKIYVYENRGLGHEIFMTLLVFAFSIFGIGYIVWSLILLQRHKKKIVNHYSDIEKVDLNWLKILIWGMGFIWFLVIFLQNDFYNFVSVVLFVFVIGFFGVRQTAIIPQDEDKENSKNELKKAKYLKSGLKEEQSDEQYKRLLKFMIDNKVFTESELVINDLASKLEIHPNHLSQIINEKEGKNFFEFINHYRIEEFKRLVSEPKNQQFTLLSLAYECGFNSKSSFNRHFKKNTGQTPSQYLSQLTNK